MSSAFMTSPGSALLVFPCLTLIAVRPPMHMIISSGMIHHLQYWEGMFHLHIPAGMLAGIPKGEVLCADERPGRLETCSCSRTEGLACSLHGFDWEGENGEEGGGGGERDGSPYLRQNIAEVVHSQTLYWSSTGPQI